MGRAKRHTGGWGILSPTEGRQQIEDNRFTRTDCEAGVVTIATNPTILQDRVSQFQFFFFLFTHHSLPHCHPVCSWWETSCDFSLLPASCLALGECICCGWKENGMFQGTLGGPQACPLLLPSALDPIVGHVLRHCYLLKHTRRSLYVHSGSEE